jgi:hypothetical protein
MRWNSVNAALMMKKRGTVKKTAKKKTAKKENPVRPAEPACLMFIRTRQLPTADIRIAEKAVYAAMRRKACSPNPRAENLLEAFNGDATPQGAFYWHAIYTTPMDPRRRDLAGMVGEPRCLDYIRWKNLPRWRKERIIALIMDIADKSKQGRLACDFDPTVTDIHGAFVWANTPQGQDFWALVADIPEKV